MDGVGSDGVGHAKHAREDSPDVSPGFGFNSWENKALRGRLDALRYGEGQVQAFAAPSAVRRDRARAVSPPRENPAACSYLCESNFR